MVAAGVPDLIQVVGAQATLGASGTGKIRNHPHELFFELIHPGRRKKHGRVTRGDQRVAFDDPMLPGLEVIKEFCS